MKVLVLGCGSMGRRRVETALGLGCDVAVYDPARDLERLVIALLPHTTHNADLARQQEVAAFAREEDAWAWKPDVAVVATPTATHGPILQAYADAERSIPIFVEKPLALSVDDAPDNGFASMFDGVTAQVGYSWRFHPLVCAFRQKMRELGTPRAVSIWVASDMRTWPGANYADALLECSHEIDTALDLFGPAELAPYAPGRDVLRDAWRLELRHESGCRTIVTIAGRAARPARGLRALFDEYEGGYDVPIDDPRSAEALEISYARELRYFLDVVAGRTPPDYEGSPRPATLADGLAVLRLIDRARELVV